MPNWLYDKENLEARITSGRPAPENPSHLRLDEIEICDSIFQHRTMNEWASAAHIKTLLKALTNTGNPFEPLTVLWAGDGWVLVDGHHRYKAYQEYEYDEPVPVNVFNGTLDEALGEALRANVQDKLPMSAKEKVNAAWRLVVGSNLSINRTAALSLASRATVKHMRKVRDTLNAKSPGWVGQMDWRTARSKFDGKELSFNSGNDWINRKAVAMAEQLKKSFGKELSKYPKALWLALEMYDSNLLYAFCTEHGIDPEVIDEHYGRYVENEQQNPDF